MKEEKPKKKLNLKILIIPLVTIILIISYIAYKPIQSKRNLEDYPKINEKSVVPPEVYKELTSDLKEKALPHFILSFKKFQKKERKEILVWS